MKYIRNLHNQGDDHVFSVSPQTRKNNRPFVGIVIICDDKQYCIPLSSPKAKHYRILLQLNYCIYIHPLYFSFAIFSNSR